VIEALEPDRLLILETSQIATRMPEIAAWAGVPPETLRRDRNWLFSAPKKHGVLATLDESYVQDTAERFCGPLMPRFFPGVSWAGRAH
jgi:hypothetical protein